MGAVNLSADVAAEGNYATTRFNALRHGVLSRFTILPWENEAEYQTLLAALVADHVPNGPTEEHLVEELAGIIWRKRRLRIAEAAVYRDKLRDNAVSSHQPNAVAGAALLPISGHARGTADIARAIASVPAETARDLRELKRDQGMSQRALTILRAGSGDAYERALAALRDDTRGYWQDCLAEDPEDGLTYAPTAEALQVWIERHWAEWYEQSIAELQHRDAIREQAVGVAYTAQDLEIPVRYEVHLDRKLERTLAMLIRLRELRQTTVPA